MTTRAVALARVFRRRPDGQLLDAPRENGWLTLHSIGFECPLEAVYEDVVFPSSGAGPSGAVTQEAQLGLTRLVAPISGVVKRRWAYGSDFSPMACRSDFSPIRGGLQSTARSHTDAQRPSVQR